MITISSTILYACPINESGAYERLHAAIVTGEFSPGERLIEEELAERFDYSRGAVRAALVRLAHDGLVVRERNRGARVRRVTIDEAIEIVEARCVLESLAAGYAAVRRTDSEARELARYPAEMGKLHAAGELLEMSSVNHALHRRILEISRHHVALEICGRLRSQVVRFQYRTVLAPGRAPKSIAEHTAIVEAISDSDREAAERAMRDHLSQVVATLMDVAARERAAS
jgi:DNA-binding GntR family transcriptional regulator